MKTPLHPKSVGELFNGEGEQSDNRAEFVSLTVATARH